MFIARQLTKMRSATRGFATVVKVGDSVPSAAVGIVTADAEGAFSHSVVDTAEYFANRKVVLVGFPGPFTGTCTATHIPEYIQAAEEIKAGGADEIVCMSLSDPFVMKVFAAHLGGKQHVNYLADGNGEFTKALGVEFDLSAAMLSIRNKRFSMIIKDSQIVEFNNEDGPALTEKSAAKTIVSQISQ